MDGQNPAAVFPLDQNKILGLIAIVVAVTFANAASTGGGSFYVISIMFFFQFDLAVTSALSNSIICVSAIMRFLVLLKERHPVKDTPLVDYNLVMLFLPSSLLGTKIGVLAFMIFPEALLMIITGIAFFVMAIMMVKNSWKKIFSVQENLLIEQIIQEKFERDLQIRRISRNHPDILQIIEEEKSIMPFGKLLYFILVMILMVVLNNLQADKNIKKCSPSYWGVLFLFIATSLVLTLFAVSVIKSQHNRKEECGYNRISKNEIVLNSRRILIILLVSFSIGVISAGAGIGGTLMMVPILLQIGYSPEVASTSSLFSVIFKSFSTVFLYYLEGKLYIQYVLWFNLFTIIVTSIITYRLFAYIKRTGKSYIIVLFLAIVLFVCAFMLPINIIYKNWGPSLWQLKNFCN